MKIMYVISIARIINSFHHVKLIGLWLNEKIVGVVAKPHMFIFSPLKHLRKQIDGVMITVCSVNVMEKGLELWQFCHEQTKKLPGKVMEINFILNIRTLVYTCTMILNEYIYPFSEHSCLVSNLTLDVWIQWESGCVRAPCRNRSGYRGLYYAAPDEPLDCRLTWDA